TVPVEPTHREAIPETKPLEPKSVERAQPEQVVHEVEAQVSVAAPPKKSVPKPQEPETAKSQPAKPSEPPHAEPVVHEPELRTAAPLPLDESQPQPSEHVFSLPGFRLPSATIEDAPQLEKVVEAPRQQDVPPQPPALTPFVL